MHAYYSLLPFNELQRIKCQFLFVCLLCCCESGNCIPILGLSRRITYHQSSETILYKYLRVLRKVTF